MPSGFRLVYKHKTPDHENDAHTKDSKQDPENHNNDACTFLRIIIYPPKLSAALRARMN
jgi:hypothetical protein